jgi:hypothetical protein
VRDYTLQDSVVTELSLYAFLKQCGLGHEHPQFVANRVTTVQQLQKRIDKGLMDEVE